MSLAERIDAFMEFNRPDKDWGRLYAEWHPSTKWAYPMRRKKRNRKRRSKSWPMRCQQRKDGADISSAMKMAVREW